MTPESQLHEYQKLLTDVRIALGQVTIRLDTIEGKIDTHVAKEDTMNIRIDELERWKSRLMGLIAGATGIGGFGGAAAMRLLSS